MCNETDQPKTKNTFVIQLDEDGQRRFAELLSNPPRADRSNESSWSPPESGNPARRSIGENGQQDLDDLLSLVTGMFVSPSFLLIGRKDPATSDSLASLPVEPYLSPAPSWLSNLNVVADWHRKIAWTNHQRCLTS